jgi:hypothetical protein
MTEGFNGNKWILYFLNDAIRMNFVYTLPSKSESILLNTIQQFIALVNRLFNREIKIFRSDNETSLGNKSNDWIKTEGYNLE